MKEGWLPPRYPNDQNASPLVNLPSLPAFTLKLELLGV